MIKETPKPEALGQSDAFLNLQEQISKVAPVDRPVLILGEKGTGKELAISKIHYLSKRWQKPLVTLNCAALTPTLIGTELFGYEKGAFTGASSRRKGRFETASAGTLFLDEIGIIPMEVQEKILRVAEYGSFERVGASESIHVDVRLVAATNADLKQMTRSGEFKQDLLDRLSFEVIYMPPLRERKGDVQLLAAHFANRMAFELGWEELPRISATALKALESYPWPGNIRELKNVIERAVYKSATGVLTDISFDPFQNPYQPLKETSRPLKTTETEANYHAGSRLQDAAQLLNKPLKKAIAELEIYMISNALDACRFNQKKAAKSLGLTYDQFRGLKKKYQDRI